MSPYQFIYLWNADLRLHTTLVFAEMRNKHVRKHGPIRLIYETKSKEQVTLESLQMPGYRRVMGIRIGNQLIFGITAEKNAAILSSSFINRFELARLNSTETKKGFKS